MLKSEKLEFSLDQGETTLGGLAERHIHQLRLESVNNYTIWYGLLLISDLSEDMDDLIFDVLSSEFLLTFEDELKGTARNTGFITWADDCYVVPFIGCGTLFKTPQTTRE